MNRSRFLFSLFLLVTSTINLSGQQLGGALAISGNQILVGEANNGTMSGIVYVFDQQAGTWSETSQIMVSDQVRVPDGFGRAISVNEETLLAGAPLENDGVGAAYVFQRDGAGAWNQVARLQPARESAGARFGSGVVIQDNMAVISAPNTNDGAGMVHTFLRSSNGDWSEEETLSTPGSGEGRGFGGKLALDDTTLLIGSANETGEAASVFAFRRDPVAGKWHAAGELIAESLPERSGYGAVLGVSGGLAFIGAAGMNNRTGLVFVFEHKDDEWSIQTRLGPLIADLNASFGSSLAFDGSDVLVGAPGSTNGSGALYRFHRDGSDQWIGASTLTSESFETDSRALFGGAVSIRDGLAVIGAPGVDVGSGAATVFRRNERSGWAEEAVLITEMRGFPVIAGGEIECSDGQAAAFDCKDVNITAFLPIKDLGGTRGTRVNDVWGWTSPTTGREIAIVGRTNGTSFVDISDPYNPHFLGDLPATEGSRHMIWRDIKVYRDHAYIVADAALEHGVQVFDLRQLEEVRGDPVTFEPTNLYSGIHSAHNIVINEETGYAYTVGNSGGGETCGGGLHMIDLADPAEPKFAGRFAQEGTGRRGTGYAHDAQCVIYRGPDTEHAGKEVCFGLNETHLNIADVSDKNVSVSIATTSYPNVAYAHQGWLTDDHRYFFMNDEGDEPQGLVAGTRTLVWDVTDLDDPILTKEYIAETTATDHNLYIVGDVMYQSNYSAGFRVLDISDPVDPVEIGFFDTSPYEGGASWSNYPFFKSGIIAVTGTSDGLFLLKNMAQRRLVP